MTKSPHHSDGAPGPTVTPEQYEQIVESLASGVIAFDRDGVVIVANSAACKHLGVTRRTLKRGVRIAELEAPQPFLDMLSTVLKGRQPLARQEILVPQPDGSNKEIGLSASLLKGPDRFNGAVVLFVDMTERRTLERAAELNRQLAQVGELTSGVVHQLRNPLSVITGRAELLQRKLEADDPMRRSLDIIYAEAKSLERSISQFLGFAKPFALETIFCRPDAVGQRVYELCEPAAQKKGVALDVQAEPPLPEIEADVDRLAQAIGNIVSNAIDAVDQGGQISLTISHEGPDIQYEILDNGPGMPFGPGEDPFKPFVTKKHSGTGLGLAICHKIVTAHGGAVTYANRGQGGARFLVRIPIRKGAL